ncbi:hypothetical protein [Nocardia neocaledoniensis]|uniref:hypothetical protein n=1 Tax=Nocardia neocaledoniensis TaxID=236511 RepID=UPI002458D177|nr:hypothetical protein [Nocardia neocaledoniensis]
MPTILAVNGDAAEIAARLLAAAGDQPDRVKVVTGTKYIGFSIDDELAEAAGYVLDDKGQADLDAVPLLIDDTLPIVPWIPDTEAQEAADEVAAEQDEPEQATPAEPAEAAAPAEPVEAAEPVEPKAVAPKAPRRTSRSK